MEETPRTPVITIGLNAGQATFDYAMAELKNLVEANHMTVVEEVQQALSRPQPGTYFGTGKVEELATIVADDGVDTVVVNDELTPSQIRNLEKVTKARIIDRTGSFWKFLPIEPSLAKPNFKYNWQNYSTSYRGYTPVLHNVWINRLGVAAVGALPTVVLVNHRLKSVDEPCNAPSPTLIMS